MWISMKSVDISLKNIFSTIFFLILGSVLLEVTLKRNYQDCAFTEISLMFYDTKLKQNINPLSCVRLENMLMTY